MFMALSLHDQVFVLLKGHRSVSLCIESTYPFSRVRTGRKKDVRSSILAEGGGERPKCRTYQLLSMVVRPGKFSAFVQIL